MTNKSWALGSANLSEKVSAENFPIKRDFTTGKEMMLNFGNAHGPIKRDKGQSTEKIIGFENTAN